MKQHRRNDFSFAKARETNQQGWFGKRTLFDRKSILTFFALLASTGIALAQEPAPEAPAPGDTPAPPEPVPAAPDQAKPAESEKKKSDSVAAEPAWVTWKNGDELKGVILPTERGDIIRLKSDLFVDPFDIKIDQLVMIRYGRETHGKFDFVPQPFRITLMTGDVLGGKLKSISGSEVVIQSPKLNNGKELKIKRDKVASIERMDSPDLVLTGPHSQRGWKSVGRERKIGDWIPQPHGELTTRRWHGDLYQKFDHPDKMEVSFNLRSTTNPVEFTAGFYLEPSSGPALETWDDTLVLTNGNDFDPVMKISEGTKNLSLKIFWDKKTGRVSVHDALGKQLASLEGAKGPDAKESPAKTAGNRRRVVSYRNGNAKEEGFALLNKSTDLSFSDLRIRKWDGKLPKEIKADTPRVVLEDGSAAYGAVPSATADIITAGGQSRPLDSIRKVVFDDNPTHPNFKKSKELRDSYVSWLDGTLLSGKLRKIEGNRVSILPPWSNEPITAGLSHTRKIAFFNEKEADGTATDQLFVDKIVLKGRIAAAKNDDSGSTLISWQPAGSINASALASGVVARVVRPAPAGDIQALGFGRVYLTNNEVLTGNLLSIDKTHVHFESEYCGVIKIDPNHIRALDIEATNAEMKNFGDSGWERFPDKEMGEDSITIEKDKAVLKKGGFGHRTLLNGDEMAFDMQWKAPHMGSVTLRMFLSDFDSSSASTDILLASQGSQLYLGESKPGGAFSFSGERVPLKNGAASIRIVFKDNRLQVHVNERRALTLTLDPAKQSGNGFVFQTGGGWQGWNRPDSEVTFTNFEIKRSPGYLPKRVIDPDAKREALVIPRFRRENPPTHVLIAPNGDMLRGRLIAASDDKVRFTSKLDSFDFPRDRVSTIVWLKQPETAEGDEKEKTGDKADQEEGEEKKEAAKKAQPFVPTHRFVLHDGSRLSLKAREIERDQFVGDSELLGECKIPLRAVREIRHGAESSSEKSPVQLAYTDWILESAAEPVIPTDDGGESSPLIGEAPQEFQVKTLDGNEYKLSHYRGKVVVLDFWATWCGPCIRAMPEIFRAVGQFENDQVSFLAVNQGETPPIIENFLEQRGWAGIPVGLDTNQKVGDQFQVQGIPHTVVIGKDGKVTWVHSGFKDGMGDALAAAIVKALEAE
ncbi:MAG: TlpA family protein disulfide reductase [Verrucomicrobiales bacterium]|nr:TlpA family protein disulfide reductase [Verrucomicrobiales bacterium]